MKHWITRLHPPRVTLRHVAIVVLFLFAIANVVLWHDTQFWDAPNLRKPIGGYNHPIQKLMIEARTRHDEILSKRSTDLESAAARYRDRRGRHPPPGFDRWFQAALRNKAIVVEDYFDRIYKDLTPYWTLDPEILKQRASSWHFVVKVREGKATAQGDVGDRVPWLKLWTGLVKEFAEHLPDVDMPINYLDESRLLVPFETIAELVKQESRERRMLGVEEVTTQFKGLKDVDDAELHPYDPEWHGPSEQYWNLAVKGCGPDTPAYGVKQAEDLSGPAEFPQNYTPSYAHKGYIQNWTAAMDPCLQPHIRQLHGTFIEPISLSSTEELIPLFGGSKLPMNNEILIPGAMYLSKGEFYSGGENHGPSWARKKDGIIWRGMGSGGRPKEHSWHRFQRHRLVDMLNGTSVSHVESNSTRAMTFELPSRDVYPNRRIRDGGLGAWLKEFSDTAFVYLCSPHDCEFFNNFFKLREEIPMKKQYNYKFLPDVDGNSFSARFRSFLRSTSLPLKATIYAEWHDDRLVPWLHFVPLDNTFQDLYPVLDFFADGDGRGDIAAHFISERGKEWAEAVLRREDMRLYMWRLLLEWARVCDENRHTLGFVEDLKTKKKVKKER
ncbi:Fc.00g026460.m01.CDS01 [Cosmosporella sp. VM-42]